ncbi:MAG: hypothetical protein AB7O96_06370 [Pseudobdellovibrionaceae bacterium]
MEISANSEIRKEPSPKMHYIRLLRMKKIATSLILMISLLSNLSFAQESFTKLDKKSARLNLEPAIGAGTGDLSMTFSNESTNERVDYKSPNNEFYFLNLSYKNLAAGIKQPKSTGSSNQKHAKVTDYQLSFGFLQDWKAELFYQKYRGYYMKGKAFNMMNPNLSFEHVGTQILYIFNPKYAYSMVHDAYWEQDQNAGSYFIGIGYDRVLLKGDLVPDGFAKPLGASSLGTKSVRRMAADSLVLRPGYGYNWIWEHWYAGVSIGLGIASNAVQYQYLASQGTSRNLGFAFQSGLSYGYRWKGYKIGIFGRVYSWQLKIEDRSLSSTTGLSGLFLSSVF